MNQVSSITQAIQSSGLTPTGLSDLLLSVDAEASKSEVARMTVILDGLCNLAITEGRKLLTETAKQAKGTPKEKVVKVRVSEARQLYGAVKLIPDFRKGIEEKGFGWHTAVAAARNHLEAKGIKADGGAVKTPEQRADAKLRDKAEVILKAEILSADGSDERTVAELRAEAFGKADSVIQAERVKAHAKRIMEAEGKEYGLALADELLAWEPEATQA